MAIVRKLERITLGKTKQTEVESCTYSIIQSDDGKYLQIDSYGSAQRKVRGGKSQSIRFSPEAIIQLREILSKEL
ncbi:MAG: hypothetical protein H7Z16_11425 [Pyrinomonadaceae bacterium]|nr:hypothetical protein [Pyrinomonadaceae bacterium]